MPKVKITRREAERGLLPQVCALTGEPTDDVKSRKFMWNPPWVAITLLAGLLPYVIIALITRKNMTVELPLVRAKHGHWMVRTLLALLGLFGSIGLAIGGGIVAGDRNNESIGLTMLAAGGILFVATIVLLIVFQFTTIRPLEITDRTITLTGIHQGFIDALEEERDRDEAEYERERDERRGKRTRDEDYEDRRPKAKRSRDRDEDYEDRD